MKFSCQNNEQKLISILRVMQQILDDDNDDFIIDLSSVKREEEEKKNKLLIEEIIIIIYLIFGFGLLINLNNAPFFGGFEKMMNDMVNDFEKDFFGNDDDDFFS